MNPLLEQFLQEARENLAFIDQNIEKIGGDDPELLNAVFRAAHTLKGGSGIVGFESVKTITHHAEDLLDSLRSNKIEFKSSMIEALYDAFDEVMNLVEAAEETEEIVDADEATVEAIVETLAEQMRAEGEAAVEALPFALVEDAQRIIDLPMPFLRRLASPLPFALGEPDRSVVSAAQLYAVVFDVDEDCMLFGNDPVYALSLLGEQVVGMHACMGETAAKSVLSGMDDPEGMTLKVELVAFVHATYAEIEDALFNFVDEMRLLPLDVQRLLQVSRGQTGHQLDLLRELCTAADALLDAGDVEAILAKLEKAQTLIGSDTIQYRQIRRLAALIGAVAPADLPRLKAFFASMDRGGIYDPDAAPAAETVSEPQIVELEETAETPAADVEPDAVAEAPVLAAPDMNPDLRQQLKGMLEQQLKALAVSEGEVALERIRTILTRIRAYFPTMPERFESKSDVAEWLEVELGLKTASEPKPEPQPVVAVEPAKPDVAAEPVQAVESVKPALQPEAAQAPVETVEEVPEMPQPKAPQSAAADASKEPKKNIIGKTVKIEQEAIDNLMNIVGELLVAKNSLPYLAEGVAGMNSEMIRRAIMEKYTFINRLSEQLQDLIMSMRMLPISYVFDRYPKLVRDISKNLGKKVKLEMDGGETKLDKNMIEMLADPMIHIMRNSLDHGIEAPSVRSEKGKDPEGSIRLNAYAQSDKIIIEIHDDGAGINVDRVVNKVLEKGLLDYQQIDQMSFDEKAELVMLPGLSTAEQISEYSGRGVGMDVVKKSIESFGGTIRIKTVPNQGTVIVLSIPVSLAVTSLLHVTMNGIHYGFPMDTVSETVKIERTQVEYLHNEPFVYIRGEVIPLLFVKSMLDEAAIDETLSVVVLNIKGNLLAVVVNELLGQLDVVQKPLEGIMESHPILSGTALLGNGQIIMAIDPMGLLAIAHELKQDDVDAAS